MNARDARLFHRGGFRRGIRAPAIAMIRFRSETIFRAIAAELS
jgi:hypothetical protein